MSPLSPLANALWAAAFVAVLMALAHTARGRSGYAWLLCSWGCLCLSLILGHP